MWRHQEEAGIPNASGPACSALQCMLSGAALMCYVTRAAGWLQLGGGGGIQQR